MKIGRYLERDSYNLLYFVIKMFSPSPGAYTVANNQSAVGK